MAFQTVRNAYRKNPNGNPKDYYNSLMYRMKCGREVAMRNKELYAKVLKYTTQEKILDYLNAYGIDLVLYEDYLNAASWLQLDFADTKVLFPRNFRDLHEDYTKQYADHEIEVELKKAEGISKKMYETAQRFGYLADFRENGMCVFVAQTKADLIREGSFMHHCVGRMDYDKRQAEGRSVICFIRKESDPALPFATVEVSVKDSLKVVQCYGKDNSRLPELDNFVSDWMAQANKTRRKSA